MFRAARQAVALRPVVLRLCQSVRNASLLGPFQVQNRFEAQRCLHQTAVIRAAHQPFTLKTVQDRIMLVLQLYDKIDPKTLTLDSDFFKDLGLDSLDFVEVIVAVENEFQFEIPDGDSDRFKTPRDIFQYICDKEDVYE